MLTDVTPLVRQLLTEHGQKLLTDPFQLRCLLLEHIPQLRLERNLLALALEQEIIAPLQAAPMAQRASVMADLQQRLESNGELTADIARWAVETWAAVLYGSSAPTLTASPAAPAERRRSVDLLPGPFAWVEIPGGRGTMETDEKGVTLAIPTARYWIGKYPVTHAQYQLFIDAGGYRERRWWTDGGWAAREKKGWTEPRFWDDGQFNGAEQPVVGVSWYEAVAFCLWLSDVTGEKIMLPTEAQWQYAAQGGDGRAFPWGNKWDCRRCNNSVSPCRSRATTPVRQYEGKVDSPCGVVDMAGNVWEWCVTAYKTGSDALDGTDGRVLRGGSWYDDYPGFLRAAYRVWINPDNWNFGSGFRCARSS